MALAQAAHKVVQEFDFSAEHVNKAVHEFLREMGSSWSQSCCRLFC